MSVKALMAAILQDQMTVRGVNSLSPSDYEEIVELLIEQLRELELSLAARELADKGSQQSHIEALTPRIHDWSTVATQHIDQPMKYADNRRYADLKSQPAS